MPRSTATRITPSNGYPPNQLSATANADLNMLVVLSGKERRKEEFEALLGQAEFELNRLINTRAGFSIPEASPV